VQPHDRGEPAEHLPLAAFLEHLGKCGGGDHGKGRGRPLRVSHACPRLGVLVTSFGDEGGRVPGEGAAQEISRRHRAKADGIALLQKEHA
jgi:hypothetical protein